MALLQAVRIPDAKYLASGTNSQYTPYQSFEFLVRAPSVVYRIGSAMALMSLNNWNHVPRLLWRLFRFRDVLSLHFSVKHNCLLFKTTTTATCFGLNQTILRLIFFWPCIIVQTCFNYQLNAQFIYSIIICITLWSLTCFEQCHAHLQEVKLCCYSIWYRHSAIQCTGWERTVVRSQPMHWTVAIKFDLLKMSMVLLEHVADYNVIYINNIYYITLHITL
jgi:hypothetical protein